MILLYHIYKSDEELLDLNKLNLYKTEITVQKYFNEVSPPLGKQILKALTQTQITRFAR